MQGGKAACPSCPGSLLVALASKLKVFLSWEQLCSPTPPSLAGSSITNHSWLCPFGHEVHCPVICAGITLGRGNGEALLDEPIPNECSHFPQRDVVMLELFGKTLPSVGTGFVIPIVHPHCSALSISWCPSFGVSSHKLPAQKDHSLCCDQRGNDNGTTHHPRCQTEKTHLEAIS